MNDMLMELWKLPKFQLIFWHKLTNGTKIELLINEFKYLYLLFSIYIIIQFSSYFVCKECSFICCLILVSSYYTTLHCVQ